VVPELTKCKEGVIRYIFRFILARFGGF